MLSLKKGQHENSQFKIYDIFLNNRLHIKKSACRSGNFRRGQNAVRFRPSVNSIGPVANTIILGLIVCLIGLIYLVQNSKTNNYGYEIQGLKQKTAELKRGNDELMVESARLQSIEKVKSSPVTASLVAQPEAKTVK